MGFGLGLGVNDTALLKESLKHLGIMVLVSILASTLYYLVTPLELDNLTEMLARTRPLSMMYGRTLRRICRHMETCRKEKGTVISGVAIATTLIPPLCAIGYGIVTLNLSHCRTLLPLLHQI